MALGSAPRWETRLPFKAGTDTKGGLGTVGTQVPDTGSRSVPVITTLGVLRICPLQKDQLPEVGRGVLRTTPAPGGTWLGLPPEGISFHFPFCVFWLQSGRQEPRGGRGCPCDGVARGKLKHTGIHRQTRRLCLGLLTHRESGLDDGPRPGCVVLQTQERGGSEGLIQYHPAWPERPAETGERRVPLWHRVSRVPIPEAPGGAASLPNRAPLTAELWSAQLGPCSLGGSQSLTRPPQPSRPLQIVSHP